MTVGSPSWSRREMVRWLVTCASSLNIDSVISVVRNWSQLFTPVEAAGMKNKCYYFYIICMYRLLRQFCLLRHYTIICFAGIVAQMIVSEAVTMQLKLENSQKEELTHAVHTLALQCATTTPTSCALHALTLCKSIFVTSICFCCCL